MAQTNLFSKELLAHKTILIAAGLVGAIAIGSAAYYAIEIRPPAKVSLPDTAGAVDITASGSIEPLQNPDLSFQSAGRITYLGVSVGDRVYTGQTLASLDVAALAAQKAQAEADVKTQMARLDQIKSPPRDTDTAVRQASLSQAEQVLANAYADIPSTVSDAFAKAQSAVYTTSDPLFSNANTLNPMLSFSTTNNSFTNAAVSGRIAAGGELTLWQSELAALSSSPRNSELDSTLDAALVHLAGIRTFEDELIEALNNANPSASFTATSIAAAQSSMSVARGNVNGLITALTDKKQALISDTLAIVAAKAQLDQLLAGASTQDVSAAEAAVERAQANVRQVAAQIAQNVITAPFSGTVGSVSIKTGQLATLNAPAITLIPDSGLDIEVAVTEIDVTKIKIGDSATVTVDAYGSNRIFPAHVSQVDQAPSMHNGSTQVGVSAYGVKIVFDSPDPSIKTGMTANVTIHTQK